MRTRLVAALVGVATLILVVFSIPLVAFVARVERERLTTALERDAFIIAGHAKETLNPTPGAVLPSLEPYVDRYAASSSSKVIVTNSSGRAVSTSDDSVLIGSDFSNRPEVAAALGGAPAVGERASQTLGERLVFVAVPVLLGDEVLGVVRLSSTRAQIDTQVRRNVIGIIAAGAFTLAAAALVAVPLALTVVRPLRRLTARTERLAEGDFSVRADDSTGPPEVKELSRSFNLMAGRLGSMIEGQRQFAGAVSHQLRTPLTALRLRLEMAQSMAEGDARLSESLEASLNEADRLQGMVEQLLALARLEGETSTTITVDAARIARERVDVWESLAAEKLVSMGVTTAGECGCAVLEGALEQIIDNFIDNALAVSPPGGTISVVVSRTNAHVTVDVIDQGPGLSAEECARAFERFWRGPRSQQGSGTGLGLAIVKQLAVASGGTAELTPVVTGGLRSRVTLVAR